MMYSQYDEEKFILAAVTGGMVYDPRPGDDLHELHKPAPPGRYLDIGAWNAKQFSNTRALYELGWSGVMIEPSPACMLGLLDEYGESERITLIQAAVFTEAALLKLHVTDDAVSTLLDAEYGKWKDHAKFRGSMMVPTITLADLVNRYGGFQFVNIDAEGCSADLFLQMLGLGIFPDCVCVEHESRLEELASNATAQGYVMVYANGTNSVFARKA
jgi:FkbM family methyltransferase